MPYNDNCCNSCRKYFPNEELDMYKGEWICARCEEYIKGEKEDEE